MVATDDLQEARFSSQSRRRTPGPPLWRKLSMNGHPSSLQLERFSVNDLAEEAQESTRSHVQDCGQCRRSLGELEQAREDCLRQLPPERLVGRIAQKRRDIRPRRLWIGLTAFTAAAVGLALILFFPRIERVQLKGSGVSV